MAVFGWASVSDEVQALRDHTTTYIPVATDKDSPAVGEDDEDAEDHTVPLQKEWAVRTGQ